MSRAFATETEPVGWIVSILLLCQAAISDNVCIDTYGGAAHPGRMRPDPRPLLPRYISSLRR